MPLKAKRIDSELKSLPKAKAAFIEPMLLQRTEALPEGADWLYELKLDGYRALGIKTAGMVQLRSRKTNIPRWLTPSIKTRMDKHGWILD